MTLRSRNVLLLAMLAMLFVASQSVGDGLIFSLPADGMWAEYSGQTESRFQIDLPQEELDRIERASKGKMPPFLGPQKMKETVRVSSVGVDQYPGRPCRWIELRRAAKAAEGKPKPPSSAPAMVLKMLIPEKSLSRGGDPLGSSYLTFFSPKEIDIKHVPSDPGFDRIRYEIERFFVVFPPPLQHEQRLPAETIVTPIGAFKDCEVIRGDAQFDRPLLGGGRWEEHATWTIALHHDAPFGVVRLKAEGETAEFPPTGPRLHGKVTRELTIAAKGDKAVSELPDAKRKALPKADVPR